MKKKQRFLTVNNYGQGGIWQYIYAYDSSDIVNKYPKVHIVAEKPKWLIKFEQTNKLKEYDIDENHIDLHCLK
jgi:hypothetical protein